MNLSVTGNGELLNFTEQLPSELLPYKIFPVSLAAEGAWGSILFQVLTTPAFSICYTVYSIKEESSFTIKADMETTALYFALKNKFHFDTTGLGTVKVKQHHFNLTYLPVAQTTIHFTPGKYKSFDISYKKGYLNRYVPYLKGLEQFIRDMEIKIPGRLHPSYLVSTSEMINVINSILRYNYSNDLAKIYIDCKAQELLTLCVEKMNSEANRKFNLSPDDIGRIEAVHKWLSDNIDFSGSLLDLAQQFQTNDFKLKRGFKELYGTTIFDMLFVLRMDRARIMLLETRLSVAEIGYRAGYSSGSHFSDAFRKHFGYPPTFLRKK